MISLSSAVRIFVCKEVTDMRCSFERLSGLAKNVMEQDPLSGHLFVFLNRLRDSVKILYWDRSGYAIWYKRLEQGKFHWPVKSSEVSVSLSGEQLNWLLDGYDVWRMKPHQSLQYLHAA